MTDASSPQAIEDALRRPKRYWNADGIPEIAIGAFWLLWAAIVLLPIAAPALAKWKNLISILGVLMAPLLMDKAVKRWKERVTFPRGGYVQFRPPSGSMRLTLVVIAAVLGAGAVLLVRFGGHHVLPDWMAAVVGFLISLTLLQLAWRMRSLRLGVLCWAVAAVGMVVSTLKVSHDRSIMYVFLAAGVVCVLDGALRMWSYVRTHPLPAGEPS